MQSAIRSSGPPRPHDLLLGFEDDTLASIVMWRLETSGTVVLVLMAVSVEHRGRGGAVARQTVEEAGRRIRRQAAEQGWSEVVVRAYIDEQNRPSQALAEAYGLVCVQPGPLQQWGSVFTV